MYLVNSRAYSIVVVRRIRSDFYKLQMFYVYILRSLNTNRYYIGSCENLNKRTNQHNTGVMKSTKAYVPWEVVCSEKFHTLLGARRRELQIKSWKSRKMINKLVKHL